MALGGARGRSSGTRNFPGGYVTAARAKQFPPGRRVHPRAVRREPTGRRENADTLDDEKIQAFAAEIGFSETTFVEGRSADGWDVRIFTPETGIPFAGHPTIGTARVVREHVAEGRPDRVVLDLDVGEVPVEVRGRDGRDALWMTQQPPEFGPELTRAALADVLSVDVAALDAGSPVQIVSTGLPTIVVPLASRAALTGIELDWDAYRAVTGTARRRTSWRSVGTRGARTTTSQPSASSSARGSAASSGARTTTSQPGCSRRSTAFRRTPRPARRTGVSRRIWSATGCSGRAGSTSASSRGTGWVGRRCYSCAPGRRTAGSGSRRADRSSRWPAGLADDDGS